MEITSLKKVLLENYKIFLKNILQTYIFWFVLILIILFLLIGNHKLIIASLFITSFTIPSIFLYFSFNLFNNGKKYKNFIFALPLILLLAIMFYIMKLPSSSNEWNGYIIMLIFFISIISLLNFIFIKKVLKK